MRLSFAVYFNSLPNVSSILMIKTHFLPKYKSNVENTDLEIHLIQCINPLNECPCRHKWLSLNYNGDYCKKLGHSRDLCCCFNDFLVLTTKQKRYNQSLTAAYGDTYTLPGSLSSAVTLRYFSSVLRD